MALQLGCCHTHTVQINVKWMVIRQPMLSRLSSITSNRPAVYFTLQLIMRCCYGNTFADTKALWQIRYLHHLIYPKYTQLKNRFEKFNAASWTIRCAGAITGNFLQWFNQLKDPTLNQSLIMQCILTTLVLYCQKFEV